MCFTAHHSLCLCCKLGIKHAPASGSTEGLAKGNLSHLTAGCLPNRIELCTSFAVLKSPTVLHKNTVNVITLGHGPVQNNRIGSSEETKI